MAAVAASARTIRSEAAPSALGRLDKGQFADPGRLTVGEYLDQWLTSVRPVFGFDRTLAQ